MSDRANSYQLRPFQPSAVDCGLVELCQELAALLTSAARVALTGKGDLGRALAD